MKYFHATFRLWFEQTHHMNIQALPYTHDALTQSLDHVAIKRALCSTGEKK